MTKANTDNTEIRLEVLPAEDMSPTEFNELVEILASIIVQKLKDNRGVAQDGNRSTSLSTSA